MNNETLAIVNLVKNKILSFDDNTLRQKLRIYLRTIHTAIHAPCRYFESIDRYTWTRQALNKYTKHIMQTKTIAGRIPIIFV